MNNRIGKNVARLMQNRNFSSNLLLIRESAGTTNDDGIYEPGATETISIKGVHQKATDDDRSELEVSERLREVRTVWIRSTDKNLLRPMRSGANQTRGDIIQILGINYRVAKVDNFSNFHHIKAICVRIKGQSD